MRSRFPRVCAISRPRIGGFGYFTSVMVISNMGSPRSRRFKTSKPETSFPKMVCRPSRWYLGHVADEKLRTGGIRARVGHGEGAGLMLQIVLFIVDFPARPAGAVPIGIPALSHETLDDAMEGQSLVKAGIGQMEEIGNRIGSLLEEQLHLHRSLMGLDFRENLLGLASNPGKTGDPDPGPAPRKP